MAILEKGTVLEQLRRDLPQLSGREARAARHLLANYPMAGLTTVAEFAAQSGVSTATILRLVKRLGFSVYADFQAALRRHLEETLQSPLIRFGERQVSEGSENDPFLDRFMEAMVGHMQALRGSVPAAEFEKVVALLSDPRRDIHIVGGRYSSNLGAYVADLLTAVRGRVFTIRGQTQQWPQHLLDMGKSSVLLVFDVRRYQQDVIEFAGAASRRGATVVLLTDAWQSPASRAADHVLTFQVESPSIFDVLTIGMALSEALVGAVASKLGGSGRERIEALEELRRPFAPKEAGLNRTETLLKRGD
ncbi:MurR/RpiR family transcriptional regulator [Chelativorans sp.]|uniref:MurR/RpiR family transcriptional regulator n=1 Tax=Chelativorans sp. TaxID=2203393 RepID=UPI002811D660|nr:MurR/RpiR family transcriptional regulator [Chelativorans sp.]